MPESSVTVYLKLNQITQMFNKEVYVSDVAEVYCSDEHIQNRCKAVKIKKIKEDKDYRYVMNAMDIVKKMEALDSRITVDNMGEQDFIIDYQKEKKYSPFWQWTKTLFVCSICFFGAAFAIMTFNNDSSATEIFKQIYFMVMGTESDGFTIVEVSYSLGLALGVILFFNHFAAVKINTDPTPLEVEMRLYEDNVNKTVIQNAGRKETGIDVT